MTLYEIDQELLYLLDQSDDDGEIADEIFEKITNYSMLRAEKVENIALYIKNLTAQAEAIKAEKQNLERRQRQKLNRVESLKGYLRYALDGEQYESARVSVSFRKSQGVVVMDESIIPDEYLEPTAPKILRAEISKAIKAGKEVPGAYLESRENIQIK